MAVLGLLLSLSPASAQVTWTQTATGSYTWNTTPNWSGTYPNSAGAQANVESALATGGETITLSSDTVGILNLGTTSGSAAFTLSGSTLTMNYSGSGAQINEISSAKSDTISSAIVLADTGGTTISSAATSGNFTISGGITGSGSLSTGNLTIDANAAGTITFQTGSLNNTGTITNMGNSTGGVTISSVIGSNVANVTENSTSSTLTLTGANTYSGGTSILNGTILAGVGSTSTTGALGTGGVTLGNGSGTSNASLLTTGTSTPFINVGNNITVAAGSSSNTLTIGGGSAFTSIFSGTTTLNNNLTVSQVASGVLDLTGKITGGGGGTASYTLTFNNAGTVSSTGVIGGGTGAIALTQSGAGTTYLSGANSYTGATSVTNGTLVAENASALGSGSAVSVSAGKALDYFNSTDAQLSLGSLSITGGSTTIGGTIGSTTTSSEINVTGAATASGTVKVNLYENGAGTGASGTYTLIAGNGSSTLGTPTYTLGTVYNDTNFTVNSTPFASSTPGALNVAITGATALTNAYWSGGNSSNNSVWAATNGGTSNWVSTVGGSAQALVPGATTTVYFSDTGHITTAPTATILGANMSIAGLVIQDTVNGLTLNADGNTLTIGTGGITMNTTVPASTIGANVALNGNQTWANASANALTISGLVSGTGNLALQANSTGSVVLSAAISDTGSITNSGSGTGTVTITGAIGSNVTSVNENSATSTLYLNNPSTTNAFGPLNVVKGTLSIGGSGGQANEAGTGTITLGDGTNDGANAILSLSNYSTSQAITTAAGSTGTLEITQVATGNFKGGGNITLGNGTTLTILEAVTSSSMKLDYFGAITVSGTGNLILTNNSAAGAISFQNSGTQININGTVSNTGSGTGTDTILGHLGANVSGITENSSGVLVLSGANTNFAGTATATGGTLQLQNASALNVNDLVTVNGGTLDLDGYSDTIAGLNDGSVNTGIVTNTSTVTSATSTLTIGGSGSYSFSGVIKSGTTNALALTMGGTGTQTLSGLNTYTGSTTVNAGTLQIDGNTAGTILSSSTGLTMGGGTLNLLGQASAATNQTVASLATIASTASNITLNPNGSSNSNVTTLTITSTTLSTGSASALNFNLSGGTTNASTSTLGDTVIAWNPTLTGATGSKIIGGGYTVSDAGGTGYATVSSGDVVRLVDPGNDGLPASASTAANNYFVASGYGTSSTSAAGSLNLNLSAAESVTTVTVNTANYNTNDGLTLGANKLSISSNGGFLFTGANPYAISGSGGISAVTSGGGIVFNNYATGTVTISAPILANGTNAVTFFGPGTTVLSGANTYTGETLAAGTGTLQLGGGSTSGTLPIAGSIVDNATLAFNRSNPVTQGVDFSTAAISGTGSISQVGAGALTLNAANTYSGGTTVSGGTLYANNTSGSATGSGAVSVTSGTLAGSGAIRPGSIASGYAVTVSGSGNITPGGVQSTGTATGSLTLDPTSIGSSHQLLSVAKSASLSVPALTFNLGANQSSSQIVVAAASGSNIINFNVGGNSSTSSVISINDLNGGGLNLDTAYVLIQGTTGASGTTFEDNGTALTSLEGTSLTAYTGPITGTYSTDNLFDITSNAGLTLLTSANGPSNVFAGYYGGSILLFDATNDSIDVEVVPEPSTWAMMLGGLALLLFWQRQRVRGSRR